MSLCGKLRPLNARQKQFTCVCITVPAGYIHICIYVIVWNSVVQWLINTLAHRATYTHTHMESNKDNDTCFGFLASEPA